MLQDSRSPRTNPASGAGAASVGKTITRRMTGNGCSKRSDRTFELGPSSDLIMNDFDDERTLDEEEAMEGSEDSHNELSNLQKEGDMPLNELLAKYGYNHTSTDNSNSSDQLVLIRDADEPESALNPDKADDNEAEEFDDEAEEEEDEDDGDDDEDDEDEDDDEDASVRRKIANKSQPSLRQFYTEMVKKKEAERLNEIGAKSTNARHSGTTGDRHRDDGFCGVSYGNVNRDAGDGLVSGPGGDAPPDGEGGGDAGNNAHSGGGDDNDNGAGRPADEEDDDEEDDEEEDDDEDGEGTVAREVGVSSVGSGNAGGGSSRLLRSVSRPQSEEEDDDCDYSPDEEEWKKTIMVGSDYQATIPEGLCRYDDALPYENEDKILWNPTYIPEDATEEFLERAQLPTNKGTSMPAGPHIRDDEQALYLLLQCGYNLDEALRRRRMNVLPPTDAISLWSEEECHNFESGLRAYGKDFHLIQKNKVRTRSVGELVQFYYLWKKTERHDIFTYKARLEKKKYALHPGITDYMDRFLEEQEGVRDRSSSPNVNCLIHGDAKRQRSNANMTNNHNEGGKSTESWDGATSEDPLGDANSTDSVSATVTSPPSSLLPPPAPPPLVSSAPASAPLLSSSSSSPPSSSSSNVLSTPPAPQLNPPPVPQNHETPHDYPPPLPPSSDNVLSHLPP
ncbi:mesoderm induction early response protein 1 isoform X2 [Microplitis mediator]|uniref:mesoderm induction early response protein 1 isoform X2 n=1 Tax=Microplitis mediator TaxID=375433 RepID=UPI00255368E3|nr:mesoderm induction early response protein 1 isoform X2 [Microplitis mediator]